MKFQSIVLFFLVLAVVNCTSQEQWLQKPGMIATNGEVVNVLSDPSFTLLTVKGLRMTNESRLEPVAAYHAIVSLPGPNFSLKASGTTRNQAISSTKLEWKSEQGGKDESRLELTFDGESKLLIVQNTPFPLSDGNLFFITLDPNWNATTKVIRSRLVELTEPKMVLDEFKSASTETVIRQLQLP